MGQQLIHNKEYRDQLMSFILAQSIAAQIKSLRAWKKWTQKRLAEESGLSLPVIVRLESGNTKLDFRVKTLCKIAHAFDVALIVRFECWSTFLVVMREECFWVSGEDEINRLYAWHQAADAMERMGII